MCALIVREGNWEEVGTLEKSALKCMLGPDSTGLSSYVDKSGLYPKYEGAIKRFKRRAKDLK